MIEFEKQTWYNKGDAANAAKRIPISASQLNRIEDAILSMYNHINDMTNRMTNHWWGRRKIVGGALEYPYPNTFLHIYPWDTITQESTVYYSSSVNVKIDNSTGKLYVELDDPNTVNISYYSIKYDNVDEYILRDQFIILSDDGMNFLTNTKDGGTTYSIRGHINEDASGERYGINFPYAYKTQIMPFYGDDEYVYSTDRNAYPDSGTSGLYGYEYLGVPFANAREGAKIETGTYVGTGTHGVENPNTLTFNFEPKVVFVTSTVDEGTTMFVRGCAKGVCFIGSGFNVGDDPWGSTYHFISASWSNKTLNWHSVDNADHQSNYSNEKYQYVAIY